MWFLSKYNLKYIEAMRKKIQKMFPEQYHVVEKYEKNVINKLNVK